MGLLEQIDMELQKDLLNFVKEQEEKPYPHTLGDALLTEIPSIGKKKTTSPFVYVFFGRIIGSLERNVCALADL